MSPKLKYNFLKMLPKQICQKILKCQKNPNLSPNQNSGDWNRSPWSCSPSTSRKKLVWNSLLPMSLNFVLYSAFPPRRLRFWAGRFDLGKGSTTKQQNKKTVNYPHFVDKRLTPLPPLSTSAKVNNFHTKEFFYPYLLTPPPGP